MTAAPSGMVAPPPRFLARTATAICANPACGREFRRQRSRLRAVQHPTCSRACSYAVRAMRPGYRPSGGRILRDGYAYLRVPAAHHLADSRGYAPEHLVVAERLLGRRLRGDEMVKRLGYDAPKSDNRPERLFVVSPRGTWRLLELVEIEAAARR